MIKGFDFCWGNLEGIKMWKDNLWKLLMMSNATETSWHTRVCNSPSTDPTHEILKRSCSPKWQQNLYYSMLLTACLPNSNNTVSFFISFYWYSHIKVGNYFHLDILVWKWKRNILYTVINLILALVLII